MFHSENDHSRPHWGEAAVLLVSTKDRDLWQAPTLEVRDLPACVAGGFVGERACEREKPLSATFNFTRTGVSFYDLTRSVNWLSKLMKRAAVEKAANPGRRFFSRLRRSLARALPNKTASYAGYRKIGVVSF